MHFDFDGPLKFWRLALEALTQSPVQFRVAGFHSLSPTWMREKSNIAVAKAKFGQLGVWNLRF